MKVLEIKGAVFEGDGKKIIAFFAAAVYTKIMRDYSDNCLISLKSQEEIT